MPTESSYNNETARDKIFYLNIRSLRNHHDQLVYELSELEYKPIAICLCETWLTDNDPLGLYQIEGYQPVEVKNRPNKRGGGLAVFVRNDMNYSMMNFSIDREHAKFWSTDHPILYYRASFKILINSYLS